MVGNITKQKRKVEDRVVAVLDILRDGHLPKGSRAIRLNLILKRGIPGSLVLGDVRKHKTFQR